MSKIAAVAGSADPPHPASRPASHSAAWLAERPALTTIAIAILTATVSFLGSWRVSFWVDEGYTLNIAQRSLPDIWRMLLNIDMVHGLYNVSMHPWVQAFGTSELALRLPSALAVGGAAAGVCVLTRQLCTPAAAVAAGLVFAVLPRVTFSGIEARSYALTIAVAVWWTVVFVIAVRRPRLAVLAGYAVLGGIAITLNIFMIFMLGVHGLALLIHRRFTPDRPFWAWLVAALAALAAGLPVLSTAVRQSAQIGPTTLDGLGYLRSVAVNQWFLGETPTIWMARSGVLGSADALQLWRPASVLLAAAGWLLIAAGLRRRPAGTTPGSPDARILVACWLALPTAMLVGYALLATPIYNPRYLAFCTPAVAIGMGLGLVALGRGWRRWLAAGLVVALALPVYASQRTVFAKKGSDWKLIAAFVSARRAPHQAVYYAPRTPPIGDRVGATSRTAAYTYPDAYAGLRDLTLVSSAAADANLLGRSRPLADAVAGLAGIRTVFVVRRADYPAEAVQADTALLVRAGFRADESWTGPVNAVTEFVR